MEIFVLMKHVPDTASIIRINDDGQSIRTDDIKWVMNPYDEIAVEEALKIKEKSKGTVTVLSVGPDKAADTIRKAMAMGADKGILINDPAALESDSIGIARILASVLKDTNFDLIIAGQRAVDGDQYQVGPAVAEFLNIPQVSLVTKVDIEDKKIVCDQSVEGGTLTVESSLPALFTTQKGLNEPRYTSMAGIMKAKKKPLEKKSLADIGVDPAQLEAKTQIIAMKLPPERKAGIIIKGESAQEKAAALVKALHEDAKVI
ncbi:Electron transfer flavoprotein subunit beta [Candidatus Magnetomoraceae bacterium gMMP-15]